MEAMDYEQRLNELRCALYVPLNAELFEEIKSITRSFRLPEGTVLKDGIAFDDALDAATYGLLNETVFDPCEKVFMFYNEPRKTMSWLKNHLVRYDMELRNTARDLIVKVVADEKRFQDRNGNLDYIISELKGIELSDLVYDENLAEKGWIEHFTGEKQMSIEPVLQAIFAVRGFMKTKEDIVKDFIQENYNVISRYFKIENLSEKKIGRSYPLRFRSEYVEKVFELLKPFVADNQHDDLLSLLQGRGQSKVIVFLDNGNRLTDAFRKFHEKGIIRKCEKKELQEWLLKNFRYTSRRQVKTFSFDYLEKCISRNSQPCKNPIPGIEELKMEKSNAV
jgi:hypothetical protein